MKKEQAYGVIAFYKVDDEYKVLLVRHVEGGHWSFPKGHAKEGEGAYQAALRELQEETGVSDIKAVFDHTLSEEYEYDRGGELFHKQVGYYICLVPTDIEVTLQPEEISAYHWITKDEVPLFDIFASKRALLIDLFSYLEATEVPEVSV